MFELAKFKKGLLKWGPYFGMIIFALLFLYQCDHTQYIEQNRKSEKEFLQDSISYYKNKSGQLVAEKISLQGDKQTLQILLSEQVDSTNQLKKLVKKFRRVEAAGNITTYTQIDSIFIPYQKPVQFSYSRKWRKATKFYMIEGISNEFGITINSLQIPNTLSFAIGEKKTGFFKTEYRIEATTSNPHVNITGLDSYTFQVPQKHLGLSLYVGYGLSDNFTFKYSAGIALTYTFLKL